MFVLYTNVCLCVFGFVHEGGYSCYICNIVYITLRIIMSICLLFVYLLFKDIH